MRTACLLLFVLGGLASPALADDTSLERGLEKAGEILARMDLDPGVVRSKHFHILYVGDRDFAELRRENLELTYRNLRVFVQNKMRMKINLRHERLLVILLDNQKQMLDFGRLTGTPIGSGVAGFYVPAHNWSVFFNQRNSPSVKALRDEQRNLERMLKNVPDGQTIGIRSPNGSVQRVSKARARADLQELVDQERAEMYWFNIRVTQHEGAHHIAHNVGVQQRGADYPFWVSEGLACLFETPPRKRGASIQGAGKTNQDRLKAYRAIVRKNQQLGLRKLIRNPEGARAAVDVDAAYAESWATFEYLFRRHSTELRNYLHDLADRSENPERSQPRPTRVRANPNGTTRVTLGGVNELEVFERFFGPVDALQKEMDTYFERLK